MPEPRVLRRFWPVQTKCPRCQGVEYLPAGRSRGGRLRYRTCTGCQETYVVVASHREEEDGLGTSRIVPE